MLLSIRAIEVTAIWSACCGDKRSGLCNKNSLQTAMFPIFKLASKRAGLLASSYRYRNRINLAHKHNRNHSQRAALSHWKWPSRRPRDYPHSSSAKARVALT